MNSKINRLIIMFRYAMSAVVLALPLVIAAPLPRELVGLNTWVFSKGDFSQIEFPPSTSEDKYAIGLHLPGRIFPEGQTIPALIAIQNRTNKPLGLDMRFDFHDRPGFANSSNLQVINRKTEEKLPGPDPRVWQCGNGPRSVVLENGFFCQRVDIGPFPVGDYECYWTCEKQRSNCVQFTINPSKVAKGENRTSTETRVIEVKATSSSAELNVLNRHAVPGKILFDRSRLACHPISSVCLALGSGVAGRYYPRIRDIPADDGTIRIDARWTKLDDLDRVEITLKSSRENRPVSFAKEPSVYLLVEYSRNEELREELLEKEAEMEKLEPAFETPLTLELRLRDGWRNANTKPHVRILISSEPLDLERFENIKRQVDEKKMLKDAMDRVPWSGVILSRSLRVD